MAPGSAVEAAGLRAVMDAANSRRAPFYGLSAGAARGILFAATHPERVAAPVVRSCSPRTMWAPDFPWGRPAVKDLVPGSGIEFTERGLHELKGIPGEWKLFALVDDDAAG
jgi:pimeloyl-ACP methyl ester carboxylesterase